MEGETQINQIGHFLNFEEINYFGIGSIFVEKDDLLEPESFPQCQGTSHVIELKDYSEYETNSAQSQDILFAIEEGSSQSLTLTQTQVNYTDDIDFALEKKKSNRLHVNNKRKKRGEKSPLQMACKNGYFTKNYLPMGKNFHFDWIQKKMGSQFIQNNPILLAMKKKNGISLQDYLLLYTMKDLREIWAQFFRRKVLYRDLMLSRAKQMSKIIFAKYLHRYQEAYETGDFDHIA